MRGPGGGHAAAGPGADGAPDPGVHVKRSLSLHLKKSCIQEGEAANALPVAADGGCVRSCVSLSATWFG